MSECKDGYNCSDAVPHRLAMRRRFLATVPVGAALETPAASNLCAPTRPMARAPVGNAKTHSTPSHYDGVEHKWWLPSPPPPPPPPPWASSRRPRHHIRRRLRRATRCVGAFAAAPAQHARALSAIDPCCGHELARLGSPSAARSVARASRRAAQPAPNLPRIVRAVIGPDRTRSTNACSRFLRKRSTARRRRS